MGRRVLVGWGEICVAVAGSDVLVGPRDGTVEIIVLVG
jgi:hypothetical protein